MSEQNEQSLQKAEQVENRIAEILAGLTETTAQNVAEHARDSFDAATLVAATTDEKFVEEATERKKEEIRQSTEARVKEEQARSKDAETKLQEANYGVYSGVANYAGISKPLPIKMQRFVFGVLAVFQIFALVVLGVPTSLLTIFMDCANTIVKKLSAITKSARWLVIGLIVFFTIGSIALMVINFFEIRLGG